MNGKTDIFAHFFWIEIAREGQPEVEICNSVVTKCVSQRTAWERMMSQKVSLFPGGLDVRFFFHLKNAS